MVMESRAGYLRSAYFFFKLRQRVGMSLNGIAARVLENQYKNICAPTTETITAYFEFKRDLSVDPFGAVELPFLLALAREFPGCEDSYFHPAFDLLFGIRESVGQRVFLGKKFLPKVIQEIERREAKERGEEGGRSPKTITLAEGMRAHNSAQKRQRGRPKVVSPSDGGELKFAHNCMLRLPANVRDLLFVECKDIGLYAWARCYRSVAQEIKDLERFPTLDGLAALLAMYREAAQIGDRERFLAIRMAIFDMLTKVTNIPKLQTYSDLLSGTTEDFCRTESLRLYDLGAAFDEGLPASWKGPQMFAHFTDIGYAPRPGDQPGTVNFDCVLNPDLLKNIRTK